MEITTAGIVFTVVVITTYFLPFEKIFDDEGSYWVRVFIYAVSFFVAVFSEFFYDVVWVQLSKLSLQNLTIDIIALVVVFVFTNKENRAIWVLTIFYFSLLEAYIKHESVVGVLLHPKIEDIFIAFIYLVMRIDFDPPCYLYWWLWDE